MLIGGLLGISAATATSAERPTPTSAGYETSPPTPAAAIPPQDSASSRSGTDPDTYQVPDWVVKVFVLAPLLTLLAGLLLAFPVVLLGVSLVMDGGCLRYLCFGAGWLCSIFLGLLAGIATTALGVDFLFTPTIHVFIWGYLLAGSWGKKKLESMPPDQYQAWKHTLTGGALLGMAAGSVASLFRSAASGFSGFGGGSFGGGGAGSSWTGGSGIAGSGASTTATGGTSSAIGKATTVVGGSATAVGTDTVPNEGDERSRSPSPFENSGSRGFWTRLRRWFQKFQWYHGFAFLLTALVFVPLGLGTMQALQNTTVLIIVLVCAVAYVGYKLLRPALEPPQAVLAALSSFRGGEASSTWS